MKELIDFFKNIADYTILDWLAFAVNGFFLLLLFSLFMGIWVDPRAFYLSMQLAATVVVLAFTWKALKGGSVEWISVKDNPPPFDTEILIFDPVKNNFHLAEVLEEYGTFDTDDEQCFDYKRIDYYKLLPKPPKTNDK